MQKFIRRLVLIIIGYFWGVAFKIESKMKGCFDEIIGYENQKLDLAEVIQLLKSRSTSNGRLKQRVPKGILIDGPKGTGKTLIAKAFIAESKLPFIIISGSEINSAKDVKHLFLAARVKESCIIFIDEFDVIGKGSKDNERIIAQLTFEMNKRDHVLVVATTRNVNEISYSLKRPGRFEVVISMLLPDFSERMQIIEYCGNKKRIDSSVSIEKLAQRLTGISTLEIMQIMNKAMKIAEQNHHKNVMIEDFSYAQMEYEQSVSHNLKRTINELKMTAYHEAGHAVCAFLSHSKRIREVSIIPTQSSFGHVATYTLDEYGKITKQDLETEIMISLAGRAAEELFFNSPTSGAKGDIEKTAKFVKQYLTEFCFDEKIGIAPVSRLSVEQLSGTDLNNQLLNRSVEIMNLFYERTKEYLKQNQKLLEEIVKVLLHKKVLFEEEVYAIYNKYNFK